MVMRHEFIRGACYDAPFYNPRFCSTLPFVDVTKNQGSELQGELVEDDGYNSGGSLLVRSYVGGKVKCGELVLFRFDDDLMVNQPLVLSVVGKVNSKTWGRRDGVIDRATWRIVFRGSVETVEPLLPSQSEYCCVLGLEGGESCIAPFLHTRCGNGWERWWWVVYPVMKDYHVTCIRDIALQCLNDRYEEGELRLGSFYLNREVTHELVMKADCDLELIC